MRKLLIVLFCLLLLTGCGSEAASVGIIGGADGPTAVFVARGSGFNLMVFAGAVFMIGLIAGILWKKYRR